MTTMEKTPEIIAISNELNALLAKPAAGEQSIEDEVTAMAELDRVMKKAATRFSAGKACIRKDAEQIQVNDESVDVEGRDGEYAFVSFPTGLSVTIGFAKFVSLVKALGTVVLTTVNVRLSTTSKQVQKFALLTFPGERQQRAQRSLLRAIKSESGTPRITFKKRAA